MSANLEQLFPEGSVVWYRPKAYPWWPGKVYHEKGVFRVETFEQCPVSYDVTDLQKVRKFPSDEALEIIIEGKKRLKRKKGWLREYMDAIQDAVEAQQQIDPEFSLDFDPNQDVSYLSDLSMSVTPPSHNTMPVDSNVATPTTENSTPRNGKDHRGSDNLHMTPILHHPSSQPTPPTDILIPSAGRKRGREVEEKDQNGSPDLKGTSGSQSKRPKSQASSSSSSSSSSSGKRKQAVTRTFKGTSKKLDYEDPKFPLRTDPLVKTSPLLSKLTPPPTPSKELSSSPSTAAAAAIDHGASHRTADITTPTRLPESKAEQSSSCPTSTEKAAVHKGSSLPSVLDTATTSAHCLTCFSVLENSDSEDSTRMALSGSEEEEEEDEEEEDDLPRINLEADASVKLHQLHPNDVIWVKYQQHPHWPALVTTVVTPKKKKSRSKASVLFFGYNDSQTISIKSKQRIARFLSKTNEEYIEAGRQYSDPKTFLAAVDEAKNLINSRVNKEITGTPKEQFKKVMALRPQNKEAVASPMALETIRRKLDLQARERKEAQEKQEATPQEEDSWSLASSDEEENGEEDPVYGYERMCAAIEKIKPDLVAIAQERLPSHQHQLFTSGQHKKLKQSEIYGPLSKWPSEKLTEFVQKLRDIAIEASDGRFKMSYSHEVLLPEAVTRMIGMFEGISYSEARKKLETYES